MNIKRVFYRRVELLAVFCIAIISLMIVSCSPVQKGESVGHAKRVVYRSLDVEKFAKVLQCDDVVLVDVRTPEEYAAGHIEGVDCNLNVRSATFFKDYQSLPKDKLIAVYCKGGGRSKQVAGVLAGNGYKVVELSVGYDGWVKAGGRSEK